MAASSALLFVMLIATALSPFVVIFQLTRLAHSHFRNELWQVRDSIVDDMRMGRLQRSPAADRLLHLVETHISIADRHTLGDLALAVKIFRSSGGPSISDEIMGKDVPPEDCTTLAGYLQGLGDASEKHLNLASPSGWVVIPALRLAGRMSRVLPRRGSDGVVRERNAPAFRREVERVEVQLMPTLVPPAKADRNHTEDGSLLTHVPC